VPTPFEATATVHGPRDEVAGLVSWSESQVDDLAPGRCRARLRAESLGSLVTLVSVLAANWVVEVPGPPELLVALGAAAGRLADAAAGTAPRSATG
jgi:hypothetical protein